MIILSIETSCDETAVAILEIKDQSFKVLANLVSSQINIHKKYGGVVPEVAARKHLENLLPLLEKAMKQAKVTQKDIEAISVVYGPGLITSLIVGIETAKTLSLVWQKSLIPVNHIKAHILANLIEGEQGEFRKILFPALCLVVSGGHTSLVLLKDLNTFKTIGQTRDDAVGEAFDKVAKILGLGYPGGPIIAEKAENANKEFFKLPRPMINSHDFDFSFSGLKTAVRMEWGKERFRDKEAIKGMCASFQQACIDVLASKTIVAAKKFNVKTVLLGGGVSANKELRKQMESAVKDLEKVDFFQPDLHLTTDNALMVAIAAYFEYKEGKERFKNTWKSIKVEPNLEL
ncbi:MAG: tRNA (adenosine(37)-N6)-threonylcarbamoyltransferase complex transferase subunit TsaD [Candidatus Buchananbacteria bacterium RBG_13_36_9]|uniref:tRNA N6-adenosine threonylcarbamoyltransferase n=1 Tax=Candidatus Buchananbacteria bacterium RBG_13_36_9 TaxID=1797530 RepID=A0A1G1XLC3_9BACT|nr:MAG: tRNA (adenosine(37)-N6)-threonylcarbamoyltransferase complex transferase subunit TsaD [Candidatus Buchananbacteria bacterium RBG_13_36_9]